jgi:hypothetical protein
MTTAIFSPWPWIRMLPHNYCLTVNKDWYIPWVWHTSTKVWITFVICDDCQEYWFVFLQYVLNLGWYVQVLNALWQICQCTSHLFWENKWHFSFTSTLMLATNCHSWYNECDTCFDIALDSIDYDFNSSNVTVDTLDLHGLLDSKQDQTLTHVHLLAPAIASPVHICFDFAVHLYWLNTITCNELLHIIVKHETDIIYGF